MFIWKCKQQNKCRSLKLESCAVAGARTGKGLFDCQDANGTVTTGYLHSVHRISYLTNIIFPYYFFSLLSLCFWFVVVFTCAFRVVCTALIVFNRVLKREFISKGLAVLSIHYSIGWNENEKIAKIKQYKWK